MTLRVYRQDIQGLRAVAVLAVILFHYDAQLLPSGFIGVDVFLVISGYLITSILLSQKAACDYRFYATLQRFYINRFRRIAPAYYFMLALVSLASAVLFIESDFAQYKKSLEDALRFSSNQYFSGFGDYFSPGVHEQPLLHSWSIAVEMQFYLLYPMLLLLLPLAWLKTLLPVLIVALLAIAEYKLRIQGEGQATYYALYARVPEFLIGSAVVLYGLGQNLSARQANGLWVLGLLLLVASAVLINGDSTFPGFLSLPPVIGAVLLIMASNSSVSRFLCVPTLAWLGALSYSLYLWHWPILALIRYYTGTQTLGLSSSLIFVFATLLLSILSYYWIEQRFHGQKQSQEKKQIQYGLINIVFVIFMAVSFLGLERYYKYISPKKIPVEYQRYADLEKICHGKVVGECLVGDLNGEQHGILILGDSHAAMLNYFFNYLGNELGVKARIITASSCVTIPGFDYQRIDGWAHKACLSQIAYAQKYLPEAKRIILAGSWSSQTKSSAFNSALESFLSSHADKEIYILSQVPRFQQNVLRVQRFNALGFPIILAKDISYQQANQSLEILANHYQYVKFIKLDTLPVFKDAPYYKNNLIYMDQHHLNEIGAKAYARHAASFFKYIFTQQ